MYHLFVIIVVPIFSIDHRHCWRADYICSIFCCWNEVVDVRCVITKWENVNKTKRDGRMSTVRLSLSLAPSDNTMEIYLFYFIFYFAGGSFVLRECYERTCKMAMHFFVLHTNYTTDYTITKWACVSAVCHGQPNRMRLLYYYTVTHIFYQFYLHFVSRTIEKNKYFAIFIQICIQQCCHYNFTRCAHTPCTPIPKMKWITIINKVKWAPHLLVCWFGNSFWTKTTIVSIKLPRILFVCLLSLFQIPISNRLMTIVQLTRAFSGWFSSNSTTIRHNSNDSLLRTIWHYSSSTHQE